MERKEGRKRREAGEKEDRGRKTTHQVDAWKMEENAMDRQMDDGRSVDGLWKEEG